VARQPGTFPVITRSQHCHLHPTRSKKMYVAACRHPHAQPKKQHTIAVAGTTIAHDSAECQQPDIDLTEETVRPHTPQRHRLQRCRDGGRALADYSNAARSSSIETALQGSTRPTLITDRGLHFGVPNPSRRQSGRRGRQGMAAWPVVEGRCVATKIIFLGVVSG
jgi:hypothetical protein